MKKVYDRIIDMRGNLITVIARGVSLGELARIHKRSGRSTYASVLRIDGDLVTLQCFENTRGISTNDRVTFLGRQMQATFSDSLLGRRLNGAGDPIDGGPADHGGAYRDRHPFLQSGTPHYSTRSRPDQHPDDRCLQLPCQIAKNPDFFHRRRTLQSLF